MAKKRSTYGTGTTYPVNDGSGRWKSQLPPSLGRETYISRAAGSAGKREAEQWRYKRLEEIARAGQEYGGSSTLAELLDLWISIKAKKLRHNTLRNYRSVIDKHIKPHAISSMAVGKIRYGHYQRYLMDLAAGGMKLGRMKTIQAVAGSALRLALKLEMIGSNPAEHMELPATDPQRKMQVWDEGQVGAFLVHVYTHPDGKLQRMYPLFVLELNTGMRSGEIRGLRIDELDWEGGEINIARQAVEQENGGLGLGPIKNDKGEQSRPDQGARVIQVAPAVIETLRQQLRNIDLMRAASGERWRETGVLFPGDNGGLMWEKLLRERFHRLSDGAGLPRIRFHDLRHTVASILLSRGVPPIEVAHLLGDTVETVMRVYAHFIPRGRSQTASIMDEVTSLTTIDLPQKDEVE
jgi:integrase